MGNRGVKDPASTVTATDDLHAAALAYALEQGYTPPAPPPTTGASGIPIPPPAAGWTRILSEDFNTDVALGAWPSGDGQHLSIPPGYTTIGAYPAPWTDPPGPAHYDPSRVLSVHGSCLDVYLHTDATKGPLAGTVQPLTPSGQLRLRVTTCQLVVPVAGFHKSDLLWPDDNVWPKDGEMDWPEAHLTSTSAATAFMHEQGGTSGGSQLVYTSPYVLADGHWHTYTTEWVAGNHESVFRDGVLLHTFQNSQGAVPNTPQHFELQTGAPSTPPASASGHLLCDWIVVDH